MNRSESIADLAKALSQAQGEIEGAVKGNVNPAFRSKYADLGAVWDAIRAPFAKHGLAVVQAIRATEHGVACETILMHASGEFLGEVFEVPVMKRDSHGFGSAATYSRRYALMAMVGIAPIDDDGNAAAGAGHALPKIEAPDPWTDAIATEALSAAERGIEEYQSWWKKQPEAFRAIANTTDKHKAFKRRGQVVSGASV
jgi:hypothetical protein